jgi:hypothetical protein
MSVAAILSLFPPPSWSAPLWCMCAESNNSLLHTSPTAAHTAIHPHVDECSPPPLNSVATVTGGNTPGEVESAAILERFNGGIAEVRPDDAPSADTAF